MRGWMIVAACTLPFAALAQDKPAAAPSAGQGFGSQSRYWLAAQASGASSVTEERPMPGEAATLVYERYLNSFSHPIPERFGKESFTVGGGK